MAILRPDWPTPGQRAPDPLRQLCLPLHELPRPGDRGVPGQPLLLHGPHTQLQPPLGDMPHQVRVGDNTITVLSIQYTIYN